MIRRFNRYELKYVIPAAMKDRLLPEMLARTNPDDQGDAQGRYEVCSLYYDRWDLAAFRSKLDGHLYRRKLRIRRYGELGADRRVMVEIKQRINRTTQKRRLELGLEEAYRLCDGEVLPARAHALDQRVAEEVAFLTGALQLAPRCLIRYRRQALVGGTYEPGLRITFDQQLEVSDARAGLLDGAPRHLFLPLDQVVLEVKANDLIPLWLSRLLAAHGVGLNRYSKYCEGLARLTKLPAGARHAWSESDG